MRRKIKFASAILSLVASMAILTFSVYAATARKATISSSVSFTGDYFTADVVVKYIGPTGTKPDTNSNYSSSATNSGTNLTNAADQTYSVTGLTFTETNKFYGIKVEIKNEGAQQVNITPPPLSTGITGVTVEGYKGTGSYSTAAFNLAASEIQTFYFIYTLDPQTAPNFTNSQLTLKFTIKRN